MDDTYIELYDSFTYKTIKLESDILHTNYVINEGVNSHLLYYNSDYIKDGIRKVLRKELRSTLCKELRSDLCQVYSPDIISIIRTVVEPKIVSLSNIIYDYVLLILSVVTDKIISENILIETSDQFHRILASLCDMYTDINVSNDNRKFYSFKNLYRKCMLYVENKHNAILSFIDICDISEMLSESSIGILLYIQSDNILFVSRAAKYMYNAFVFYSNELCENKRYANTKSSRNESSND